MMQNNQILVHHGVKGMKWGVRRYQNYDGTRTVLGKSRNGSKTPYGHDPDPAWMQRHKNRHGINPNFEKPRKLPGMSDPTYLSNKQGDRAKKDEYKQAAKDRRNLSDKELAQRIQRLEMEKKLKTLTNDNVRSEGEKAAREVIYGAGKKVATAAVAGGAAYLGYYLLTGDSDPIKAAQYIFPNPNKKK